MRNDGAINIRLGIIFINMFTYFRTQQIQVLIMIGSITSKHGWKMSLLYQTTYSAKEFSLFWIQVVSIESKSRTPFYPSFKTVQGVVLLNYQ